MDRKEGDFVPLIAALLLFVTSFIFPTNIAAEEVETKPSLVALGDSITAGYNLPNSAKDAFPNFIGDGVYEVTNLAVPGWTSTDLLLALKDDPAFAESLQTADLITLNIGNNDLLHAIDFYGLMEDPSSFNPDTIEDDLLEARRILWQNLTEIVSIIRFYSTEPILFYTIYNPIMSDNSFLWELIYIIVDEVIMEVNENIIATHHLEEEKIHVVDAYSMFSGMQNDFIIVGDIHPNQLGQKALASIANDAIGAEVVFGDLEEVLEQEDTAESVSVDIEVVPPARESLGSESTGVGEGFAEEVASLGEGEVAAQQQVVGRGGTGQQIRSYFLYGGIAVVFFFALWLSFRFIRRRKGKKLVGEDVVK
ncbi:MAG: GDSL-type esterase/lipase family protein [Bacillus sp. (in: Bacteria)]|nr:GDSL-type esterase/lipase family protein [Bacillus sp. (in: firmicutes)]